MQKCIIILSLLTINIIDSFCQYTQPQIVNTGLLRQQFDFVAASQRENQWCWAASIEMVLNYYGVRISQEDIVRRTFGLDSNGNLINRGATNEEITFALNSWGIDYNSRQFTVSAQYYRGIPIPLGLVRELDLPRPIIIAYHTGPQTGHAVVLTACSYLPTNNGPYIQSLIVRDPWPNQQNIMNNGRLEYLGTDLVQKISGFWIVQVN